MSYQHWKVDELPWGKFDPSTVTPELISIIKAAALVEYNGHDYATYLCRVFVDDPAFQAQARAWAIEEVQHGEALGRWAMLADPSFDFPAAVARFRAGYQIPLELRRSVRGSNTGELIARCIVESGTSSYYSAIADQVQEPLLKIICNHIAADEFRHYKLFYQNLENWLKRERIQPWERVRIGFGRMFESEDDELAYAFFAANAGPEETYDRSTHGATYLARAYRFYQPQHIHRLMAMVFRACGLKPYTVWQGMANRVAWHLAQRKIKQEQKRLAQPATAKVA